MRGAIPNEESVMLLMRKTAMDKKSYLRLVPRIDLDKDLFPDKQKNTHRQAPANEVMDKLIYLQN